MTDVGRLWYNTNKVLHKNGVGGQLLPLNGGDGMNDVIYLIIILVLIERILHTGNKKR